MVVLLLGPAVQKWGPGASSGSLHLSTTICPFMATMMMMMEIVMMMMMMMVMMATMIMIMMMMRRMMMMNLQESEQGDRRCETER